MNPISAALVREIASLGTLVTGFTSCGNGFRVEYIIADFLLSPAYVRSRFTSKLVLSGSKLVSWYVNYYT